MGLLFEERFERPSFKVNIEADEDDDDAERRQDYSSELPPHFGEVFFPLTFLLGRLFNGSSFQFAHLVTIPDIQQHSHE